MEIMTVGLDCKKAPVEIRERLSFVGHRLTNALVEMVAQPFVKEAVILSTCNRVEVYILSEHTHIPDIHAELRQFLAKFHEVPEDDFAHLLYYFHGRAAVEHLFEVASGIQSMVLGEAQIQGQVKDAIEVARKHGSAGRVLDALFRAAISTGKRVRTETAIGEAGVSVSFNAVELLKIELGSLEKKWGLVVGSGQTARLTAQILLSNGVKNLMIVSRNPDAARELAITLGTDPNLVYTFYHLQQALAQADLVISATGATHPVLRKAHLESIMPSRSDRPIYMVDIAVPRDIEPEVSEVAGVHAWDIDDIKKLTDENLCKRQAEVFRVKEIIAQELSEFMAWVGALAVVPTITTLRRHADAIRKSELERARNSFGELTERQAILLDDLTNRIVNKLLHEPTLRLKELATSNDAVRYAEIVQHLFSLQRVSNEAN